MQIIFGLLYVSLLRRREAQKTIMWTMYLNRPHMFFVLFYLLAIAHELQKQWSRKKNDKVWYTKTSTDHNQFLAMDVSFYCLLCIAKFSQGRIKSIARRRGFLAIWMLTSSPYGCWRRRGPYHGVTRRRVLFWSFIRGRKTPPNSKRNNVNQVPELASRFSGTLSVPDSDFL